MFWFKEDVQLGLFEEDYTTIPDRVSSLFRTLIKQFPDDVIDDDIINICRFRTLFECPPAPEMLQHLFIDAKWSFESRMDWLNKASREWACLETVCRTSRSKNGNPTGLHVEPRRMVPDWYCEYLKTKHYLETRDIAIRNWNPRPQSCAISARHSDNTEWHHNDYGRIGCDDEWRFIVPLCSKCHFVHRLDGPSLPATPPDAVARFLSAVA